MDIVLSIAAFVTLASLIWAARKLWSQFVAWESEAATQGSRTVFSIKPWVRVLLISTFSFLVVTAIVFPGDRLVVTVGSFIILVAAAWVPGSISLDAEGIQAQRALLLPGWNRRLTWTEIDSAHERPLRNSADGPMRSVIVISAGPGRTLQFTPYHSDRVVFIRELRRRRVPLDILGGA